MIDLPEPIAGYPVAAERYLADDAVVRDEDRIHAGIAAITR